MSVDWVGHVGWPIADGLTTKWSPIQLAVWRRIGKVRQPRPCSVLTTMLLHECFTWKEKSGRRVLSAGMHPVRVRITTSSCRRIHSRHSWAWRHRRHGSSSRSKLRHGPVVVRISTGVRVENRSVSSHHFSLVVDDAGPRRRSSSCTARL